MYHPQPPPTTNVLGGKRLLDNLANQEPPQKKFKVEYASVYPSFNDYFSPFFVRISKNVQHSLRQLLTPDLNAQILVNLPLVEILSAATVSRMWACYVKKALKLYCVLHYKLQWAPCVENLLLRGLSTLQNT